MKHFMSHQQFINESNNSQRDQLNIIHKMLWKIYNENDENIYSLKPILQICLDELSKYMGEIKYNIINRKIHTNSIGEEYKPWEKFTTEFVTYCVSDKYTEAYISSFFTRNNAEKCINSLINLSAVDLYMLNTIDNKQEWYIIEKNSVEFNMDVVMYWLVKYGVDIEKFIYDNSTTIAMKKINF